MKINKLSPIIWTKDIHATTTFYKKLGFKINEENEELVWTNMTNGEIEINIANPEAASDFKKPQFTGTLYFNVENADEAWEELKHNKVVYEIETFDWGMREFAIEDNNGYILQFGEAIEFDYGDED